jgi:regulation of enolase protein 1 (concanavalin A-like superfamily)
MNSGLHLWRRVALFSIICTVFIGAVALAGPTTFKSDDFNAYQLNRTVWTLVDPLNDCTMYLQGVGTGDAQLYLGTAAGTTHDIWSPSLSAPHILQSCANENFTAEVKFTTSITGTIYTAYEEQGIVVMADANNMIRFDFTSGNADSTTAFAAVVSGFSNPPVIKIMKGIALHDVAPLYLRVNRTGNVWTMMTSLNGTTFDTVGTFTQALAVTKIGLYVGNAGSAPPAFTMVADYFYNTASPIIPEDGGSGVADTQGPLIYGVKFDSGPNAIDVYWKTDEPAIGVVDYGRTPAFGGHLGDPNVAMQHHVGLPDLASGALYYILVSSQDQGNRWYTAPDTFQVVTPALVPDTTSVSDDFNGTTLDAGLWSFVNPKGDGSATVTGGQLSIGVPGGTKHEAWAPANTVLRVVQTVNPTMNQNEWVAKFNSIPSGSATSVPMEGMYFEQDTSNLVRSDFFSDGTNLYVFSASFTNGLANYVIGVNQAIPIQGSSIWMRVRRNGALWLIYYSYDGNSWVSVGSFYKTLTLNRAGVSAGNSGSSPAAFTAVVDYFQGALPAKPNLVYPGSGQSNVPRPVTFRWDTTAGAATYRLQVSTASNFSSTVVDTTLAATTKSVSTLLPTTVYYWRVRGINGTLLGALATQNFTTAIAAPNAPSLVSPADAATGVSLTPTMIWTKSAGATTYRLQVGTDSTFAGGLAVNDSTLTDTVRTTSALAYSTRYFWRAGAKNSGGTSYSVARSFTTRAATPPVPTLLAPAKGATNQPTVPSLTLSWNASAGATSYWVQVGTDSLFTPPLKLDDSTIVATSRAVTGLAYSTVYYWHVHAKNASGNSAPSETWSFTTVVAPPVPPALLSPANGATGQLSSTAFRWTRPARATSFRLQVATDSTFLTGEVFNDSTITDTTRIVSNLAYGLKYFWRVFAQNVGGVSPSSLVYSLYTLPGDPTVPVQLAPANGSSISQRTVTLRWTAPVGASSFHLQVGTDPTFATNVVLDDPAVLDTTRTLNNLNYQTTYYWRLNADNVGGISPWSSTFSFRVTAPLPAAVTLISPSWNKVMSSASAVTAWNSSSPLVDRYQIDLATDSLFNFKIVDSTLTDTVKTFSLSDNSRYWWRVRAHNPGGWGPFSEVRPFMTSSLVSVESERALPTTISLSQNFPNPFNPSTQIEFGLPKEGHVLLEVYNILGERVATLVDENMTIGYHTVRFDASSLSSGLYIYRMAAGSTTLVHKMMLVK